jgi:hypothetical protein
LQNKLFKSVEFFCGHSNNAYGFGYAIGTSFKDAAGRRQMLWPQQLREIEAAGKTEDGFRLAP